MRIWVTKNLITNCFLVKKYDIIRSTRCTQVEQAINAYAFLLGRIYYWKIECKESLCELDEIAFLPYTLQICSLLLIVSNNSY